MNCDETEPTSGVVRRSTSFEYDPRGHLIRQLFSGGEVLERQSDAAGNLFKSRDASDRIYGRGGVIESAGGTQYKHDADGFLIEKTLADGAAWRYAWDAQGRLEEVTRPDGKHVRFAYDAFGRRVRKTFNGNTTEFIWDGDDLVHERTTDAEGSVAPLVTWLFEPGTFAPLVKIEGRKRYGIVTDHLGTPTMLTTEAGAIAWKAQLDIYGVVREDNEGIADKNKTKNPWRYPGQYEDEETGLYYNRFRYYDPEIGRYISEDPIDLFGGPALYAYVAAPTGFIDPFGLSPWHEQGVWITKGRNPRFDSKFNVRLPSELRGKDVSDHTQMSYATRKLDQFLSQKPQERLKFTRDQLAAIDKKLARIPGLTWHHHENGSLLQLVDRVLHSKVRHDGGRKKVGGRC
jgi:RHS repeat-associated protein